MIIYRAKNIINDKVYIGKSVISLEQRRKRHLRDAKNGSNFYFHRALRKYGFKNFNWIIIWNCKSKTEMCNKEKHFIRKYHSFKKDKGYNLTYGGDGGIVRHTLETRNKIRLSKIGKKNPMYGVGHSLSTKLKMSESRRGKGNSFYGKKHSVKSILKIKNNHVGMIGKKHSSLTKNKMSIKSSGENNSQNKLSIENVLEIKHLIRLGKISLNNIAKTYGVSRSLINNIKHKRSWSWLI